MESAAGCRRSKKHNRDHRGAETGFGKGFAEVKLERISRWLGPGASLAGGGVTVFFLRRGIDFAPIAVALAVAAWLTAVLLAKRLALPRDPQAETRGRTFLRLLTRSTVVGLFQSVLFFTVPIWFASATLDSVNIVFPILLAALALFSCFDHYFSVFVLERILPRAVVSAVLLFAALAPATPLFSGIPLRIGLAASAAVAALFAAGSALLFRLGAARLAISLVVAAALSGVFFYAVAPFLPPVPVQCLSAQVSGSAQGPSSIGAMERFSAESEKIYAHFAVVAPKRYRLGLSFVWIRNGKPMGKPIPSSMQGGRKLGWRTRTYLNEPGVGSYRVDLATEDGQLIGRVRFRVSSRESAPNIE
jgi:hypothetical protein